MHKSFTPYFLIGSLVAALLFVAAGAGLLAPGMYRPFLSEGLVAFQFIQDLVSVLAALALVPAMYLARRGSLRAFLVWCGLLVYVAYYYAFFAFGMVYTSYYPLYLALMGLSTYALIGLLSGVDLGAFRAPAGDRMPVRFIAFVLGMPILLAPLWIGMMVQGIQAQQPQETALVLVMDLCFLIPACVLAAVQIWRRRPLGYLLAGVLLIKATLSGILLAGGEVQKGLMGQGVAVEQLAMWLFLAVAGTAGLILYMRNLADRPAQAPQAGRARALGQPGR